MAYDVPPPRKLPEPGYYYHFKHDPDGPPNNYAYYIYGVGHHTEDDCRAEDAFMQVYRPLYEEAYAYRNGGLFDLCPLHMFFEPAEWKGKEVPRRRMASPGRVGMWRGGGRPGMSVSASFVWRCLSGSAIAPFPHPSHRTQRADFPHCALGQDFTPSSTARRVQAGSDARARRSRRGARVDSCRPCSVWSCA